MVAPSSRSAMQHIHSHFRFAFCTPCSIFACHFDHHANLLLWGPSSLSGSSFILFMLFLVTTRILSSFEPLSSQAMFKLTSCVVSWSFTVTGVIWQPLFSPFHNASGTLWGQISCMSLLSLSLPIFKLFCSAAKGISRIGWDTLILHIPTFYGEPYQFVITESLVL